MSALAAAPTLITVARSGRNLELALIAAAVVGGAGFAYAVDDDAAATLAASPTPLAPRRAARIVGAALVATTGWLVVFVVAWGAGLLGGMRIGDLAIEGVTAAGVAVAVAAALRRALDVEHTGLAGAATAVVGMLFITMLSTRYPWLPALGSPLRHDAWLLVALAAWVGVGWTARDPAGRLG
jgi:hypothetical protein